MSLTITEALAEVKTIAKRVEKKRAAIGQFIARQDGIRDPLEKDGGSFAFIAAERQAISDLGERVVALRRGIQRANDITVLSLGGSTRTISEWLTWRREVAPGEKAYLASLSAQIGQLRATALRQGASVVTAGSPAAQPSDFVINVNEQKLSQEIEFLVEILGSLDGQLSLKNATVTISD